MTIAKLMGVMKKVACASSSMAFRCSKDMKSCELKIFHDRMDETVIVKDGMIIRTVEDDMGVLFRGEWGQRTIEQMDVQEKTGCLLLISPALESCPPFSLALVYDGSRRNGERTADAGSSSEGALPASKPVSGDDASRKPVSIFTDGSCRKKIGQKLGTGAWGYVLVTDGKLTGSATNLVENTTSMDMELLAIAHGLKNAVRSDASAITVNSDCKAIVDAMNHGSFSQKMETGFSPAVLRKFRNNLALVKVPVTWQWVRGHNDNQWNEEVNRLVQTVSRRTRTSRRKTAG